MWPDRASNAGPLTYESGALPAALRGTADKYTAFTGGVMKLLASLIMIYK